MYNLKSIKDQDLKGKKILFRAPFDISPKVVDGKTVVSSDTRLKSAIPTIEYLLDQGCSMAFLTWVKRPDGKVVEGLRTAFLAERLSELLGKPVEALTEVAGSEVEARVNALKPGEMLMLENTRFYPEEETGDLEFAKSITKGFEYIVYDAFPQAMRIHASTTGIMEYLPAVSGFAFEKEITELGTLLENPETPFVGVLGGAKISDKVELLESMLNKTDRMLLGGALVNTILNAYGLPVGSSLIEAPSVDSAKGGNKDSAQVARDIKQFTETEVQFGEVKVKKLQLPLDLVSAPDIESTETKVINIDAGESLPDGWTYLDIGPRTVELYGKVIAQAKTIFANGPMGLFEKEAFATGSKQVFTAIAKSSGRTVLGGGDTETVIKQFDLKGKFTHVSTGGGASLEFLSGHEFPVMKYLIQ